MDKLNSISYAYHYRNVDSTEFYARQVLSMDAANAEAMNNLAFASIIRMDYELAEKQLDSVLCDSYNQLELLVAFIQQMRLCQRRSENREFYNYREKALSALSRINEERAMLTERERARLAYAESELAIVTSTYYYYVGLEERSAAALKHFPDEACRDTAQLLNYLYNVGAGGILTEGSPEDILQQEFDNLIRCFQIARQHRYSYFVANALEALAEHLNDGKARQHLLQDNEPAFRMINPEGVNDNELPAWLADNALAIFLEYGDAYQIAGAYRTLASCRHAEGNYDSALFSLEQALSDSLVFQAPDLVASIREQLSVVYAALSDKPSSDENRNQYLDLQEETRQDRQLEARASQLERQVLQLNWMIAAVCLSITLLLSLLWFFSWLNRKQKPLVEYDESLEQLREKLAVTQLRIEKAVRHNLDQRAKLSLANSVTPFIDRILHAVSHSIETAGKTEASSSHFAYIRELTDQIARYNDILTHWIQLRQGDLSLHIESFSLQPLFDMVKRSRMSFQMKGVDLSVQNTDATVKADRILTLFMLNTLADNARKFTPEGGRVDIFACSGSDYVEICVADSGVGMSEEQVAHLFDRKPIVDKANDASHGFGLLNCKGIIEKYRKMSRLFGVCSISAESQEGRGTRLSFRLPKGVVRLLILLMSMFSSASFAATQSFSALDKASIYADSAYFSNINGTFGRTLLFADSCRQCLNEVYLQQCPDGTVLMQRDGNPTQTPSEIQWLHDSIQTNYNLILDIRNECAVAALALHDWQLYIYNNKVYTQLFKELSSDTTLDDYCHAMQQSQANKTIAVVLLVLVLFSILPAYYFLYYRHRLYYRFQAEQQKHLDIELATDELRRAEYEEANLYVSNAVLDNCLSALKHETMYYPSRIRQLVDKEDKQSLAEVTAYYRELYGMLSQQAIHQTERVRLHLTHLDNGILGDEYLVRYLLEILRHLSGRKQLDIAYSRDRDYVHVTVPMPALQLSPEQAGQLFTPSVENIPFLLCRQIVREHGEATNRRACSIRAEVCNQMTNIIITLPAYGKI